MTTDKEEVQSKKQLIYVTPTTAKEEKELQKYLKNQKKQLALLTAIETKMMNEDHKQKTFESFESMVSYPKQVLVLTFPKVADVLEFIKNDCKGRIECSVTAHTVDTMLKYVPKNKTQLLQNIKLSPLLWACVIMTSISIQYLAEKTPRLPFKKETIVVHSITVWEREKTK